MKTLMAAGGRLTRRSEQVRRADHVTVIVRLEGDEARRFERYRGDKCPRDVARELIHTRLKQVAIAQLLEEQNPLIQEESIVAN